MKLLVDMNLSPRWIDFLRTNGFQAEHWTTLGAATASDAEIMAFAAEQEYIVLTNDLDFSAILANTYGIRPSVVQIRSDALDPTIIGSRVSAALRQEQRSLESGALLTIDPSRLRLNVLSLRTRT